ncbi:MAG: monovalent cation/H+ antiporter complex subunit F [Devosiaceae bacterium]
MSVDSILAMFDTFNTALVILVIIAVALTSYRLVKGPSYADRFVAIDMLTGLVIAACALTALSTGRDEFLDVAFALSLIAFVATAAFAAFLERKVALIKGRANTGTRAKSETATRKAAL